MGPLTSAINATSLAYQMTGQPVENRLDGLLSPIAGHSTRHRANDIRGAVCWMVTLPFANAFAGEVVAQPIGRQAFICLGPLSDFRGVGGKSRSARKSMSRIPTAARTENDSAWKIRSLSRKISLNDLRKDFA
jgi:hypothetical protein